MGVGGGCLVVSAELQSTCWRAAAGVGLNCSPWRGPCARWRKGRDRRAGMAGMAGTTGHTARQEGTTRHGGSCPNDRGPSFLPPRAHETPRFGSYGCGLAPACNVHPHLVPEDRQRHQSTSIRRLDTTATLISPTPPHTYIHTPHQPWRE
jgi:hypothetical protein